MVYEDTRQTPRPWDHAGTPAPIVSPLHGHPGPASHYGQAGVLVTDMCLLQGPVTWRTEMP